MVTISTNYLDFFMEKNKSMIRNFLAVIICFCFLLFPFRSAKAFSLFKKDPTPSAELTLILEAGRKGLVDQLANK